MLGLRDKSIKYKVRAIIVLTSTTAMMLAFIAILAYEQASSRQTLVNNMVVLSGIVSESLAGALSSNDREAGARFLEALSTDRHIEAACVYTPDGKVFAQYLHPRHNYPNSLPSRQPAGRQFRAQCLEIFQDVDTPKGAIGSIYIRCDLRAQHAHIIQEAWIFALVMSFSLAIAVLLSFQLHPLINEPIMDLLRAARIISREKNYTVRAHRHGQDEFSELIDAFNVMVSQIQDRDARLGEYSEQLEQLVADRTRALMDTNEILETSKADVERQARELRETTAQLIQTEKLSALGELVASVAHELNQPLNTTKIICQGILRDLEKGRYDFQELLADLQSAVQQINRMAGIIDHMRLFTRRSEMPVLEPVDANQAVQGVFKLIGQQLQAHNIDLALELAEDLPLVLADPLKLEQVFMNLIINARDALESSGQATMQVIIRSYQTYHAKVNGPAVVVEISDNGPGIKPELRDRIFEPFFTTKRPGQGTGLGLSISDRIIREFGGVIELDNQSKTGATIKVCLPT